ncbi:MAG: TVP38/TMEM64 family protein [Deltaproteobacteria bacterium]
MNRNLAFRIVLLVALIGLCTFLFIHFDLYLFLTDKNKVTTFIKTSRYDELVFIALQIVQVVIAVIPGEISGFIGGYLYGPFWGTLYSTIGLTIGSWLAFILAHFFGEPLLEKVVKKEVFDKFNDFMEHKGLLVSFLLFLIPGFPKDYLCYIMGVSRMPVLTFIIISTIGRFFGTMMLSVSGNIAREEQYLLLILIAVAAVIVSILAWKYHDKILDILKKKKPE